MNYLPKILVVDDDEEIGRLLQLLLEHKGYSVITLNRTERIEEMIQQYNVQLIILDMLIGSVKGSDVCRRLKANINTAAVSILMMTALPEASQICKEAGSDDFLSKPFEMDILHSKVNQLLSRVK